MPHPGKASPWGGHDFSGLVAGKPSSVLDYAPGQGVHGVARSELMGPHDLVIQAYNMAFIFPDRGDPTVEPGALGGSHPATGPTWIFRP